MINFKNYVVVKQDKVWRLFKSDGKGKQSASELISEISLAEVFLRAKELQIPTWSIIKIIE